MVSWRRFSVYLNKGHLANTCSEKYLCRKYHGRHDIVKCTFCKPATNPDNNNNQLRSSNNLSVNKNKVILLTATAQNSGSLKIPKTETVNIIFDSGSQRSYTIDNLRKRLEVPVIRKAFGNVDSKLYNENVVPVQLVVLQKVIIMEYLCSPFIYLT